MDQITSGLISVFIGLIAVSGGMAIGFYNRFKSLDLQAQSALSNIDVALSKRYDTLTNMVEVVKGYAKHEQAVFAEIAALRSHSITDLSLADDQQSAALTKLIGLAEAYPELKADVNFLHLQKVVADVEEHLQAARRLYNQAVKEYDIKLETFPSNLIGKLMNLEAKPFYAAKSEQRSNLDIRF